MIMDANTQFSSTAFEMDYHSKQFSRQFIFEFLAYYVIAILHALNLQKIISTCVHLLMQEATWIH